MIFRNKLLSYNKIRVKISGNDKSLSLHYFYIIYNLIFLFWSPVICQIIIIITHADWLTEWGTLRERGRERGRKREGQRERERGRERESEKEGGRERAACACKQKVRACFKHSLSVSLSLLISLSPWPVKRVCTPYSPVREIERGTEIKRDRKRERRERGRDRKRDRKTEGERERKREREREREIKRDRKREGER